MTAATTRTFVTAQSVSNAPFAWSLAPARLREEIQASLHFHGLSARHAAEVLLPRAVRGAVASRVRLLARDTEAVTIIEYALIGAVISVALSFILPEFKSSMEQIFSEVSTGVVNAAPQPQPPTP